MTPEKPDSVGRFVKSSIIRSAVEDDCSTWDTPAGGEPRATGRFVKAGLVRPPTTDDCSEWREGPADRGDATEADAAARGALPQHDHDIGLVGEAVNGVLVIHSNRRQLNELEGEQLFEMVRQREPNTLLLNLSGVDFVSAAFIASLLRVHQHLKAVGGRFAVCNLGGQAQQVFSLLRMEQLFSIYSNQHQALHNE